MEPLPIGQPRPVNPAILAAVLASAPLSSAPLPSAPVQQPTLPPLSKPESEPEAEPQQPAWMKELEPESPQTMDIEGLLAELGQPKSQEAKLDLSHLEGGRKRKTKWHY